MTTENWEHLSPVQKAEFTLAYLQGNGGRLPPEYRQQFIMLMIEDSDFLSRVSTVTMRADRHQLDTFLFGSRALHTASPGTALAQAQRTRPTLGQTVLTAKLWKAEARVEKEVIEDNIQQATLQQLIMTKLADRCKMDVVEIAMNSDTSLVATDPDIGQFNGFYAAISSHTVAGVGVPNLSKSLLESLIIAVPNEYRNLSKLQVITGTVPFLRYINSLGDRPTALGDSVFQKQGDVLRYLTPGGVEIVGDAKMRADLGVGTNESVAVCANPKTFFVGFHPNIELDMDYDKGANVIIFYVRVRLDAAWANEDETAKLTGIAGT